MSLIHICTKVSLIHPKGGFLLKFKLFSVVLLLVCFTFLGVLTGAIPVPGLNMAALPVMQASTVDPSPGPTATEAPALPTPIISIESTPQPTVTPVTRSSMQNTPFSAWGSSSRW